MSHLLKVQKHLAEGYTLVTQSKDIKRIILKSTLPTEHTEESSAILAPPVFKNDADI